MLDELKRLFTAGKADPTTTVPSEAGEQMSFVCNVCGFRNDDTLVVEIQDREFPSCRGCRSSLRMRTIVHALSTKLFGESMPLEQFPKDKSLQGLGLSDWEGYAERLAQKFSYQNTYLHAPPRFDICEEVPASWINKFDFVVSSEVFEHIPLYKLDAAFGNCRRLLKADGLLVLTVPYVRGLEKTVEHYPNLFDFEIVSTRGNPVIRNITADGAEELFDNPVFHGGDGTTLEMRAFSEGDLRSHLVAAGFSTIRSHGEDVLRFGIIWPVQSAAPLTAIASTR